MDEFKDFKDLKDLMDFSDLNNFKDFKDLNQLKGKTEPKKKAWARVIIASEKESYFVMGLKKKLEESGADGIHVGLDISAIRGIYDLNAPIIYYLGNELYSNRGKRFAEGIRSLLLDEGRPVILVGEKPEFQKAVEIIPKSSIIRWFPRPVKMEDLLHTIEGCAKGFIKTPPRHRILIIDDDNTFLRMMQESLKPLYDVTIKDTGMRAIRWLVDHKVDLILLDYEMPVADGSKLFSMIKSDESMKDIPIIFLTGKHNRDDVLKVLDLMPEDYILKSVDRAVLIDKMENVLLKKRRKEKTDDFDLMIDDDMDLDQMVERAMNQGIGQSVDLPPMDESSDMFTMPTGGPYMGQGGGTDFDKDFDLDFEFDADTHFNLDELKNLLNE